MNVHYLGVEEPDSFSLPHGALTQLGTALPVQGQGGVTEPPVRDAWAARPHERQFAARLPSDTKAIAPVRRRLRYLLGADGLEGVADDVALASQELLANAVLHGCRYLPPGTEVTIAVVWGAKRLRVTVHDPSAERPRKPSESVTLPNGRGLRLVDALSDRWGVKVDPIGCGKTVWFELDRRRQGA